MPSPTKALILAVLIVWGIIYVNVLSFTDPPCSNFADRPQDCHSDLKR